MDAHTHTQHIHTGAHRPSKQPLGCSCLLTHTRWLALHSHAARCQFAPLIHTPCGPLHTHCWDTWPRGDSSGPCRVHTHSPHANVPQSLVVHTPPRVQYTPHSHPSAGASETRSRVHTSTHTRVRPVCGVQPSAHRRPGQEPIPMYPATIKLSPATLGHLPLTPHCWYPPPHRGWGCGGGGVQTRGVQDTHMCPPCGRS